MAKKQHKVSLPAGVGIGIGVGITVSVLGAMVGAWMIGSGKIGEESIIAAAYTAMALSALAGSWAAVMAVDGKRMQVSLLTGLGYYLTMLAVTALFFEGEFEGLAVPAAIVGAGSVLVGFLAAQPKKKGNPHTLKKAYR